MTRKQIEEKLDDLPPMQRSLIKFLLDHGPTRGSRLYEMCGCLSFNQQLNKSRRYHGIPIVTHPIGGESREWIYQLAWDEEKPQFDSEYLTAPVAQ